MLNILLHIFFVAMAAGAILVAYVSIYVLYLIISDFIHGRATDDPMTTAAQESESDPTPANSVPTPTESAPAAPSVIDTLLAYLNDNHSPIAPVSYQDHLFSTLDMDSLDVAAMLRFMSEAYDVELPIVDLFGRYGNDPTVYQVLSFISRQRQLNS